MQTLCAQKTIHPMAFVPPPTRPPARRQFRSASPPPLRFNQKMLINTCNLPRPHAFTTGGGKVAAAELLNGLQRDWVKENKRQQILYHPKRQFPTAPRRVIFYFFFRRKIFFLIFGFYGLII